ncbi:MAG: insulinase family protein [Desulfovibrio sp.]|nr:insulinase family protein [Desulfovibrio sp.]
MLVRVVCLLALCPFFLSNNAVSFDASPERGITAAPDAVELSFPARKGTGGEPAAFGASPAGQAGVSAPSGSHGGGTASRPGDAHEKAAGGKAAASSNEVLLRLENGLTVYVIRDTRFPLVCTRLFVQTGSANEKAGEAGISHVLEHMVFKGTARRPKGKVAEEIESLGGYLNAATSFDRTWYITDLPKEHWKKGIDVVEDMAFGASLLGSELEPEKDVIVSELKRGDDSPEHKLYEELQLAALKKTPYGHPIIGFEPTIRAVTSSSLASYRNYWYQPQNMALLVAGDIVPADVVSYVKEVFGHHANTQVLPTPVPFDLSASVDSERVKASRGNWQKVYLGLAFPAPSLADVRSQDLDLLCYVLGGDTTSYLYRKYKYEKQLVDSISVDNMSLSRAGLLTLTVSLDAGKLEAFFTELMQDFSAMKSMAFNESDIRRGILNLEDSMDRAQETLTGLAYWKSTVQFLLGGETGEINARARLEAATPKRLQEAFGAWFDPGKMRVRLLMPENAQLPDLAAIQDRLWPAEERAAGAKNVYMEGGREELTLENGCRLILLPDTNAPYFSITMDRFGGNALLSPEEQGLSTLTARLLNDGAGDLDAKAFQEALSDKALSLSVASGRQSFSLSLDGPTSAMEEGFSRVNDVLTRPRFDAADIARERNHMKASYVRRQDEPLRFLFSRIRSFIFGSHVYGYDDLGTPERVSSFGEKNVRDFWEKQRRTPWVISVCGQFEREKVLQFATRLTRGITEAGTVPFPMWSEERTLAIPSRGRAQAHLLSIYKAVPLDHEDAPALMLLSQVLSGQSGLLFSSLRDDEGLGYTVTAFLRTLPRTGAFIFYIGTSPDKIEVAKQGFVRIIAELRKNPLPKEVLEKGINQLVGEYERSRQSLMARSLEASREALLGYPAEFRRACIAKARLVTPEDLMRIARKYLIIGEDKSVTLAP